MEWVGRQLEGRRTTLIFDDYRSEPIDVEDGLDQGDAHLLIVWLI